MLHAKFQDNCLLGSGEDFFKVFTIYGRGGHLGHLTWTIYINFGSPFSRRLHMKFGSDWPSGLRRRSVKMVDDGQTPDGRRLDGYTKSSYCEPNGSGGLR